MSTSEPLVLIVDDIDSQLLLYRILADRIGIKAHAVRSCKEALQALDLTDFDLIIMDWLMPDMDASVCLPAIREVLAARNLSSAIICITARAMKGDREMCLEAGFDDYLAKPFTIAQFEEIVYRWLPPKFQKHKA